MRVGKIIKPAKKIRYQEFRIEEPGSATQKVYVIPDT